MKVALPVWNGRISPLLDSAAKFLLAEFDGGAETGSREELLEEQSPAARAAAIAQFGCDFLICGGVSEPLAQMLFARGVRVVPWVSGNVDEVLAAFIGDGLSSARFFMPGCPRGARRMRRGCGRRGGGLGEFGWPGQGGRMI